MHKGLSQLVGMTKIEGPETIAQQFERYVKEYENYDYFFIHYKYTDKAGEDGNFAAKVKAIEDSDAALRSCSRASPDVLVVTGDHHPCAVKVIRGIRNRSCCTRRSAAPTSSSASPRRGQPGSLGSLRPVSCASCRRTPRCSTSTGHSHRVRPSPRVPGFDSHLWRGRADYAVCGGMAMAVHGFTRATEDINVLIEPESLIRARQAAARCGFRLRVGRQARGAEGHACRGGLLTTDLMLVSQATCAAWDSRLDQPTPWGPIRVVSRNALKAMKRQAGRPQDLVDVERMETP